MTGHIEGANQHSGSKRRACVGGRVECKRIVGQRRQRERVDVLPEGIDLGAKNGSAPFRSQQGLGGDTARRQKARAHVGTHCGCVWREVG